MVNERDTFSLKNGVEKGYASGCTSGQSPPLKNVVDSPPGLGHSSCEHLVSLIKPEKSNTMAKQYFELCF